METLPPNYNYLFVSDENYLRFRIKEVKDKESTKVWVKEYSKETKTTWRVSATYPRSGLYNLSKVCYRCVHNTDRRAKGTGPSKHTGCGAKLEITVNRFREDVKMFEADKPLIKTHPCIVKLLDKHNHPIHTAEALKYRDLDPKVKDKIRNLFRQGYNPATALRMYKNDLLLEKGSEYRQAESDGMLMPTYSVVQKLFQKEFSQNFKNISDDDSMDDNIASDHSCPLTIVEDKSEDEMIEVISQLRMLWTKIEEKVENHPDVFLPAAKEMLGNAEKFTTTDAGLVRAMCTFGNFRCANGTGRKKALVDRLKAKKQSTDIASKKICFPDTKEISSDGDAINIINRPCNHSVYTIIGNMAFCDTSS